MRKSMAYLPYKALNLILPPSCGMCGENTTENHALCIECAQGLSLIFGSACSLCGAALKGGGDGVCQICVDRSPNWDAGTAACAYHEVARGLVLALKHGGREGLAPILARMIYRRGRPLLEDCDVLIPMPLHWRRLVQRRYNQAGLLAVELGKLAKLPVVTDAVIRNHATAPQMAKSAQERFANLDSAMRIRSRRVERLKDKRIGIVDDVMTSGASFSTVTDVLRNVTTQKITVFAFARAASTR